MRQVLQYELAGATLIGTMHVPEQSDDSTKPRVGFLMANFAQAPRAGVGDLSVWLGDAIASAGIPAFRFDLPGLGDSVAHAPGEVPDVGQPLWEFIRAGGHIKWTSALIDRLCEDHQLDGMILGGLCAGAVTALYAAAERTDRCAGLVMLEPVFHQCDLFPEVDPIQVDEQGRPRSSTPTPPPSQPRRPSLRDQILAKVPDGRALRLVRNSYARLKRLRRVLTTGSTAPDDANHLALRSWREVTKAGLPTLLVNGTPDGREAYNRYYLGANFQRHAVWAVAPDTNHMMAANGGREQVAGYLVDWLEREFPAVG